MDKAIKTCSKVLACLNLFIITSDQISFVREGQHSHGRRDDSEKRDDSGELHGEQCL